MGHMAVYVPGCHTQNIIWTKAKLRSIYYFVGDRSVHKLPFGPKCHELFVILYSIHANLSRRHVFVIVYLRQKTSSDKFQKKTLYWSGPVHVFALIHHYDVKFKLGLFLEAKHNKTNSSRHFGPNGSLWTGLSPTKYYMDLSFALVHIIFCVWHPGT